MKIKFLATAKAPEKYEFKGEVVKAFYKGKSEEFDLSDLEHGDVFGNIFDIDNPRLGCEPQELDLHGGLVIRDAWRDSGGELNVLLCQEAGVGHWRSSPGWFNADNYDPDKVYIKEVRQDNGEKEESKPG